MAPRMSLPASNHFRPMAILGGERERGLGAFLVRVLLDMRSGKDVLLPGWPTRRSAEFGYGLKN
jgi:hypothetical protein